ncbi:MAG TPA: alpha/beta fold hydrolase [Allosphingosinicella sp.]|jgi:acetyl esterase/lipase
MTKLERLAVIFMSLALAATPAAGAMEKVMFLKLGTVFANEEPSETTARFPDGSSFTFDCDRYVSERGIIAHRGRPVPVVRTRCESAHGTPAGTAIWLHGGPFTKFDERPYSDQAALLSLGYELLTPLYASSADRELEVTLERVAPDMDVAVAEIVAVVQASQRSPGRVILCGESYGALLAAAAAGHLRASDKLVLFGPMLTSIGQSLRSHPKFLAAPLTFGGEPPGNLSMDEQDDLARKMLQRFYGQWLNRGVTSILTENRPRDMLIVYGEKDDLIGLDLMPALLALGGRSIVRRGIGHQAAQSRAHIDRLLAELSR